VERVRLARLEDLVVGVLERVFQFELLAVRLFTNLLLVLAADLGPREVEADREEDEDEAEHEDEARRRPADLVALPRRGRDEVLGDLGAVGAPPGRIHEGGDVGADRRGRNCLDRSVVHPLHSGRVCHQRFEFGGRPRVLDECDHIIRLVLRRDLDHVLDQDVARLEAAPQ